MHVAPFSILYIYSVENKKRFKEIAGFGGGKTSSFVGSRAVGEMSEPARMRARMRSRDPRAPAATNRAAHPGHAFLRSTVLAERPSSRQLSGEEFPGFIGPSGPLDGP